MAKFIPKSYQVFIHIVLCQFASLDCVNWKDVAPPPPITENPHLERVDVFLSKCNGVDIRELTIFQIQDLFVLQKLTSVQLTRCYLDRINAMNKHLKCVNEFNSLAIVEAALADEERRNGIECLGPMHGIPILLKENMGTADLMETTAGSLALAGLRTNQDADVVQTLKKAGAIILGKGNLSEFAYFRGYNIPSGWSGKGGQTRNPYNLNASPGGSSSGPAVGVAANLAVVALGTETDGSIIAPSNLNGICGLKPTRGLVSVNGILPISHLQDHVGPLARTITDLAILLDGMVPASRRNYQHPTSFSEHCHSSFERPFRIGIMRYPFFSLEAINSTYLAAELPELNKMIDVLSNSTKFEIIDPINPRIELLTKVLADSEYRALIHEFKHDFNEFLRHDIVQTYPYEPCNLLKACNHNVRNLRDVVAYNNEHPVPEGYKQETLVKAELTDGLQNKTYIKARQSLNKAAKEVLDSVLNVNELDAVLVPSESRFSDILDERLIGGSANVLGQSLAAISGYPSLNVPVGEGLQMVPFGVNFIGLPYSEGTLLQIGRLVEIIFPGRKQPNFMV